MEHFVRGASRDKIAGFELTVRIAVQGYHIQKDSWALTVGEEFVCYQECANEHDRHAVAVYGDGDSNDLGTFQENLRELSSFSWSMMAVSKTAVQREAVSFDKILDAHPVWRFITVM